MSAEFGFTKDEYRPSRSVYNDQYVGFKLSDSFTIEELKECLTRLTDEINSKSTTQYSLEMPKESGRCAIIRRID